MNKLLEFFLTNNSISILSFLIIKLNIVSQRILPFYIFKIFSVIIFFVKIPQNSSTRQSNQSIDPTIGFPNFDPQVSQIYHDNYSSWKNKFDEYLKCYLECCKEK
ncbi:hypothetical protein H311_00728 [Anncaliia algerae PRA109]|nr:hypothetical protein H311_00728 [Anncaliia algerae PRA109]